MITKVSEERITENGMEYLVTTYSNGAKVKRGYSENVIETPSDPEPTEAEIAQAEMMLMQAEILEKLNQIGG